MGIVVILCAWGCLFTSSAVAAADSHVPDDSPAGQPVVEALVATAFPADAVLVAAERLLLGMTLLAPVVVILLWRWDVIRPGSMRRRGVRDLSPWPWWFWLLCAFSTVVASGIGASIGVGLAFSVFADPSDIVVNGFLIVCSSIAGVGVGLLLLYVVQERISSLARSGISLRIDGRGIWLGLLAILLAMPVVQLASIGSVFLYRLVTGVEPDAIAHDTLRALHEQPGHPAVWAMVAAAVLGAPIAEELVFRVFLQSSMVRLFGGIRGGVWGAIAVSSAVFAAVHVGAGIASEQWHAVITLFILGAAMGTAYEWTKRPLVPIVMHMVFNAFNIALVVLMAVVS